MVFSHKHNTFDKRSLLTNINTPFVKKSDKTVDDFFRINNEIEIKIKRFFMEEIDELLKTYEPGEPKNKPNVLRQIDEIRKEREKFIKNNQQNPEIPPNSIVLQMPGQPNKVLTMEEVVQLLKTQQQQLIYMSKHIEELEKHCSLLQLKISERV